MYSNGEDKCELVTGVDESTYICSDRSIRGGDGDTEDKRWKNVRM
jgi:hypothetical protein